MNQQESTQRDRIYIDEAHHETYRQLTSGTEAPFKTMKDLFLLAACVGHQKGQRVCLKKRRDVFNWAQFAPQEDIPVLRALALAETGSVEVLINTD